MLIIDRKENETIDRMLKRYKRKHRQVKLRNELQRRREFTKPSVLRRNEILKAKYIQQKDQDANSPY
ncbi:MAG: bS21 family ribosomal protein [Bacteroidota bacterium]